MTKEYFQLDLEHYRLLVDSIKEYAIFIMDINGFIMTWNKGAELIKGYTAGEIVGKHFSAFYIDEDRAKDLPRYNLSRAMQTGSFEEEGWRVRKDGNRFWASVTITALKDEHGNTMAFGKVTRDLSRKRSLEQMIEEKTRALSEALGREQELNEQKSKFVSIASHEFRTPLSTILSSVALIGRYDGPAEQDKRMKHVNRIRNSIGNLTELLNEFLSLDKLEQGKVEIHKLHFNLRSFLEETVDELSDALSQKRQTTQLVHSGTDWVCLDNKILRSILLNLISNASKYSPDGNMIEIISGVHTGKLTIAIRDHGIGIPAEVENMIFTRYFRAPNTLAVQGTGLGLNIVKRYVELLDGSISFQSVQNQGTTFLVELPLE